jgi:hypothetical protein
MLGIGDGPDSPVLVEHHKPIVPHQHYTNGQPYEYNLVEMKDQYFDSEINLKHQEKFTLIADKIVKFQGNGTSRRAQPMYKSAKENFNNIYLNVNIVSLKQDNYSSSNDDLHLAANEHKSDDDESILHDEVICWKAKNVSLSISAILELAHTSDKGVIPYSLEAA